MKKIDSVLLIDDDKINNFINYKLLKKLNPIGEIKITENGKEALKYLHDKPPEIYPELIFLDINMPVMNGFEFLESFKDLGHFKNKPRIFMLTTSSDVGDMERLKNYPEISGFLNKPLTQQKIHLVIQKYFN